MISDEAVEAVHTEEPVMSENQRLLAAGAVFIGAVFAYGALTAALGERWQVLMGVLLLPYAVLVGTFIHKKLLL